MALIQPHDLAFRHGRAVATRRGGLSGNLRRRIHPPQDCEDGFPSLLGNNGAFDLALMNVKDRICQIAL